MLASVMQVFVPAPIIEAARQNLNAFFQPISQATSSSAVPDLLDTSRSRRRAEILKRYAEIGGKRLLEVGSGYGTDLAVFVREYGADGYGIEPSGVGFSNAFRASKELLAANEIDPERLLDAAGEAIPFRDESFDLVHSANVLEHTADPERVLAESLRVLRKGGILHMEMPNFLSYFEGHYMVPQPPILWRSLLPWWVSTVFRRDPSFASTLQTYINPPWCRRILRRLGRTCPLKVISLGEDLFLERLSEPFQFETDVVSGKIGTTIRFLQAVNFGNWAGRLLVLLNGFYPIYLTVQKL